MDFKQVVMDYGPAIGPLLAFFLGILAIYIKTLVDRKLERWKTARRLSNLKKMIKKSKPPTEYLDRENSISNRIGNWLNVDIFLNRTKILKSVVESMESEVLLNGTINTIMAFHVTKLHVNYLYDYCNKLREKFEEGESFEDKARLLTKTEFDALHHSYNDLLTTQTNPASFFTYNRKDGMFGRSD